MRFGSIFEVRDSARGDNLAMLAALAGTRVHPGTDHMTKKLALLFSLVCGSSILPSVSAQSAATGNAPAADARSVLDCYTAALTAKQFAEEARASVVAADLATEWLRPMRKEHQRAVAVVESAKVLEVAEWVDAWRSRKAHWCWWFQAERLVEARSELLGEKVDRWKRIPWAIEGEPNRIERLMSEEKLAELEEARQQARAQILEDLKSLREAFAGERGSFQIRGEDVGIESRGGWENRIDPIQFRVEGAVPQSVIAVCETTTAWMELETRLALARAEAAEVDEKLAALAKEKRDDETVLAERKAALPRLEKREVDTEEWMREAQRGGNYERSQVSRQAHAAAAEEVRSCKREIEVRTRNLQECIEQEKVLTDAKKQWAEVIQGAETESKVAHEAAAKAWREMAAAAEAAFRVHEECSKQGHEDAELMDRAALRWLEDAKALVRAKGR